MFKRFAYFAAMVAALLPTAAWACACGCGVFDVGTGTMLPTDQGGTVWLEYNFMNQSQNWSGTGPAPGANNGDKQIRTDFFTAGTEYMFNRSWGIEAEVPFWNRTFKTQPDYVSPSNQGPTDVFNHDAIGDVRVKGIYSGFSDDMSTGITFGVKLATGDFTYPNFDRDSSIGTGSTDLLLGGYHMGSLPYDLPFNWFIDGQWDQPFATQQNYRPGDELDAAIGAYYNGFDFGKGGKLAPLFQVINSYRQHDTGLNADPADSGYERILLSPGLEYDVSDFKVYGDVEFPVFQNVNGNQLVAPVLFKFILGYNF